MLFFVLGLLLLIQSSSVLSRIDNKSPSSQHSQSQSLHDPKSIKTVGLERKLQTTSTCNLTLFEQWKKETYIGVLSTDTKFWIYQTQPQIVLTKQLTIELSVIFCKRQFELLSLFKAGRNGPITIQDAYIPMCNEYCLQSDNLHEEAMSVSGCSCLELSTQSTAVAYTAPGDFCNENSARLLCNLKGYCGLWGCDLDDFMCPRYEWNKQMIPVVGSGSCSAGFSWSRFSFSSASVLVVGMVSVVTALFVL